MVVLIIVFTGKSEKSNKLSEKKIQINDFEEITDMTGAGKEFILKITKSNCSFCFLESIDLKIFD